MKQYTIRIVGAVLLLLGAALAWLWFDANGALRNVRWQEPEPHQPDFSSMVAQLPSQEPTDLSRFVATLERPLFSPSRRPPPQQTRRSPRICCSNAGISMRSQTVAA